jgi:hypothetical protein
MVREIRARKMITWIEGLFDTKGRTIIAGMVDGSPKYLIRRHAHGLLACTDISGPTERLFGLHEELTYAKIDCEGDLSMRQNATDLQ